MMENSTTTKKFYKNWLFYLAVAAFLLISLGKWSHTVGIPYIISICCGALGYSFFLVIIVRWIVKRFFFVVRNRIITNYILTGILPVFLLMLLIYFSIYFFMMQLVSFYLNNFLDRELERIEKVVYEFALDLTPNGVLETNMCETVYNIQSKTFPGLEVMICSEETTWQPIWHSPGFDLPIVELSENIKKTYFLYNETIYLLSSMKRTLRDRSILFVAAVSLEGDYLKKLEDYFQANIMFSYGYITQGEDTNEGSYSFTILSDNQNADHQTNHVFNSQKLSADLEAWGDTIPSGLDYFTSYTYAHGLEYSQDGFKQVSIIGFITTKFSFMLRTFIQGAIPSQISVEEAFITGIILIGTLFGLIELVALIISIVLSRSITKLISQLHRKAKDISSGEFTYRINSKRKDQLGELAESFDQMSEDLQALMKNMKEKERLEHELEIAHEVQKMFFPKKLPIFSGVELLGNCLPAYSVSGDYYDFISHKNDFLDFFIGDISGKGISAALLMASSHTFLKLEGTKQPLHDVSQIVYNFNQYLVESGSDNKYSTLFYGRLDAKSKRLFYCNAGHLPPLIIREGDIIKLSTSGMVPGLFPDNKYELDTIELNSGDLFVAYTDGFSEVTNVNHEEFGDERLSKLFTNNIEHDLQTHYNNLISRIHGWASDSQQHDDMTIILVKIL